MPIVTLGNTAVVEPIKASPDSNQVTLNPRPDLGHQETSFTIPDGQEFEDQLRTVKSVFASHHSAQPPAWVESDDEDLARAIAKSFDCEIGRPKNWTLGPQEVSQ